jgi:hypothetical protein
MEPVGVKTKWMAILGVFLGLMVGWAPVGLGDEAKPEEKKAEEPEKLQGNVQTDFLSQYVWRGQGLSRNSGVIQPSGTLTYRGFSVNVWGNLDTNEQNPYGRSKNRGLAWNEGDFTFSYTREVFTNLTLTGGLIYYLYSSNNYPYNSIEIYGGADYKLPWFNFGFNVYREINNYPGTYLMWYVHRAIDIPYLVEGMNLDLMASWSAEFSNDRFAYPVYNSSGEVTDQYFRGLNVGYLAVSLNIPVGKYLVVAPKVQYWYALGGQSTATLSGLSWDSKHNHILGGLNVTVNF